MAVKGLLVCSLFHNIIKDACQTSINLMEASVPDSGYNRFIRWAKDQGIKINGVRPAKTPNGGLGIIADRNIKVLSSGADQLDYGC